MGAYGLKPSTGGVRDYDFFTCCASGEEKLPSKFMLPIDEWADVLDQGQISACPAFALAVAKACHHFNDAGERTRWSTGYIYGNPECRNGYDGPGMILEQALKGVMKIGFIPESVFDVLEEMPQMRSYVESRPDLPELGSKRKLKGFVSLNYALESKKIEAMKRALLEYQVPLVVASYDYFAVGHAFVVYGWDDSWVHKKARKGTQIFAFRNSWGEDYEDGGNSTIPVTYIDQVYLPIFEDMPMPFEDVLESDWFYDEVRAVAFSGLMQGVTKMEFMPYGDMIRGDLALVIQRALNNMASLSNAFMKTLRQIGKTVSEIKLFGARDCKEKFEDIKGDAYYDDAILMVCANGIMHGTGGAVFEPTKPVTRCELAATLVRVYDLCAQLLQIAVPEAVIVKPDSECGRYDDVRGDDWFFKDVVRAGCLSLMHGNGDGKFYPKAPVNRAEAATSLNRLFRLIDKTLQAISEVGGDTA